MRFNKKPRSLGRTLIDLTPLLDVIFIILIVVLSAQDVYTTDAQAKVEEAEASKTYYTELENKLIAEQQTMQEQLTVYENMYDYINVINVYASYSEQDRRQRDIYVIINDEEKIIPLNPSNETKAWAECKAYIETVLRADTTDDKMMTMFFVKNEKMLYRDEQSFITLFNELSADYDNLFMKNYLEKANE